jgi:hypothetical protein
VAAAAAAATAQPNPTPGSAPSAEVLNASTLDGAALPDSAQPAPEKRQRLE